MARTVGLLHGLATSPNRTWIETGMVDLLTESDRLVIAPWLPGHGPGASTDASDYEDVVGLATAELPDEPIDLVGFSMGAQVAVRFAAAEPGRVERLVLAGLGENAFRSEGRSEIADAFAGTADADDPISAHFLQLAADSGNDPPALAAMLANPMPALSPNDLTACQMPALVVLGDRDFVGSGRPLADALENSSLRVLAGVDHFKTPKDFGFIDAVLEFLDATPS